MYSYSSSHFQLYGKSLFCYYNPQSSVIKLWSTVKLNDLSSASLGVVEALVCSEEQGLLLCYSFVLFSALGPRFHICWSHITSSDQKGATQWLKYVWSKVAKGPACDWRSFFVLFALFVSPWRNCGFLLGFGIGPSLWANICSRF